MSEPSPFRFHVDRRGRILVENFTAALLPLARALEPDHPLAARPAPGRTHEAPRR